MPLFYSHRKRAFMRWLRLGSKNIKGTLDMKAFQDFLIMFLTDLVHIIYLLISFFSFIHNTNDKTSSKLYISCIRKKKWSPFTAFDCTRHRLLFQSTRRMIVLSRQRDWCCVRGTGDAGAEAAVLRRELSAKSLHFLLSVLDHFVSWGEQPCTVPMTHTYRCYNAHIYMLWIDHPPIHPHAHNASPHTYTNTYIKTHTHT